MARFCHSCGAPLEEGARFCPSCGAPVVGTAQQVPPQQTYQQPLYQQPAYQPYYPAAQAPAAKPREGAPGGSKVMIIFYLITISIVQILNLISVAVWGSGILNDWLRYALSFLLAAASVIFLTLGIFIRKAPFLYGIGLTLISVSSLISAARAIFSGSAREQVIMNVFYVLLYSLPILLAALHYYLGGRGFKGGLKNAMMIVAFVYVTIALIFNVIEYIGWMARYSSVHPLLIWSAIISIVSFIASLFLFIAALKFTVRRKA